MSLATVARLIEALPDADVPLLVPFIGETADLSIGPDGVTFSTSWAPFFAVLALGVVAAVFEIGRRLQRETEGLV